MFWKFNILFLEVLCLRYLIAHIVQFAKTALDVNVLSVEIFSHAWLLEQKSELLHMV